MPSASIRKYSHLLCRIELDPMLTPFGPSLSAMSSRSNDSRQNGSWPRAALSPEGINSLPNL